MYQAINVDGKIFSKTDAEHLNVIINNIDSKIDNFKAKDIQYKYQVKPILSSTTNKKFDISSINSLQIGQEIILNMQININDNVVLQDYEPIIHLNISVPNEFYIKIANDAKVEYVGKIKDTYVYLKGSFYKDTNLYLFSDIIL